MPTPPVTGPSAPLLHPHALLPLLPLKPGRPTLTLCQLYTRVRNGASTSPQSIVCDPSQWYGSLVELVLGEGDGQEQDEADGEQVGHSTATSASPLQCLCDVYITTVHTNQLVYRGKCLDRPWRERRSYRWLAGGPPQQLISLTLRRLAPSSSSSTCWRWEWALESSVLHGVWERAGALYRGFGSDRLPGQNSILSRQRQFTEY